MNKICGGCGITKDAAEFCRKKQARDGLNTYCRVCTAARHKVWSEKNRDRLKGYFRKWYSRPDGPAKNKAYTRKAHLNLYYGITLDEYARMFAAQQGRCAICHQEETQMRGGKIARLSVDHDHVTNEVRGLLCIRCNGGLGSLGDTPDRMYAAFKYLMQYQRPVLGLVAS